MCVFVCVSVLQALQARSPLSTPTAAVAQCQGDTATTSGKRNFSMRSEVARIASFNALLDPSAKPSGTVHRCPTAATSSHSATADVVAFAHTYFHSGSPAERLVRRWPLSPIRCMLLMHRTTPPPTQASLKAQISDLAADGYFLSNGCKLRRIGGGCDLPGAALTQRIADLNRETPAPASGNARAAVCYCTYHATTPPRHHHYATINPLLDALTPVTSGRARVQWAPAGQPK